MQVEIRHQDDTADIRIWGFPPEDAEDILDAIRRVFFNRILAS